MAQQDDILIKAISGLITSQQELADSSRREFERQAASMEDLAETLTQKMAQTTREMRASGARLNEKMDQHTHKLTETLAVMKTFADNSTDTRCRVTQLH